MPRFSRYFKIDRTQHELDFVDVSTDYDTAVYVDPYAIEICDDHWAAEASDSIRVFFKEVLSAIRDADLLRAEALMSHLTEPKETFLGVSARDPQGRGVGRGQSRQLIRAIRESEAYKSGLLSDLSEMSLYVEGIDRDKISDLTTNVVRHLLVDYTQQQCELYGIETRQYSGPSIWDVSRRNWISKYVQLPFIKDQAVLLVPKYIVRRKLSLDGQEFYNKQITDFLIAENIRANTSLVQVIKGEPKVFKKDVREENPRSKAFIVEIVKAHPELLRAYKEVAQKQKAMMSFGDDDQPSLTAVCMELGKALPKIRTGTKYANEYHRAVLAVFAALFYPNLTLPRIEWDIHGGRKRIDIVFTNAADVGFFARRRDDQQINAQMVMIECKNYSDDIANPEFDQLLGRFDRNRGKFGIIVCREVKDAKRLLERCRDKERAGIHHRPHRRGYRWNVESKK